MIHRRPHHYTWFLGRMLLLGVAWLGARLGVATETEDRWWPTQLMPKAIVRTTNQLQFPEPRFAFQAMVQSAAGLAAKAVNNGQGRELVWIDNGGGDMEEWYSRLLAHHPELKTSRVFEPWDLVNRYVNQGLIKGYILYRREKSSADSIADAQKLDCSINVATSLAGLLDAVIVDEELEGAAKARGLKLLFDVRDKTQSWCFQTYKDQFSRRMVCTQDPRKIHSRDLAIAHKAFTVYGLEAPTPALMEWLEPLSPILGWNAGDEFVITDLSSSYGHIQTATDWCLNMPVLMAETEKVQLPKLKSLDPRIIDWSDTRSAVSFISSDGDNVQWLEGNFFGGSTSYWGNPERGKIPYGWSCCIAHLSQLCPEAIEYALETRSRNDSLIEWGGGYYFPDHFGNRRKNRWALLAKHAQRTWEIMKKTNSRIIGFNFAQVDAPDAQGERGLCRSNRRSIGNSRFPVCPVRRRRRQDFLGPRQQGRRRSGNLGALFNLGTYQQGPRRDTCQGGPRNSADRN